MKKFLLFALINVFIFTMGCKRQNIKQGPYSYESTGAEKTATFDDEEPSTRVDSNKDINLKTVYFEFDKSDLTECSIETLKENAAYLISNSKIKIILEGHTDERGTTEYNLSLGQRRALRIKEYYTKLGISSNRIATISYGKEKPAELGSNELAWSKNRRVEIKKY
ncbi:MAG: peptidoglycan-associated lipoprotein Pal [Endomicrobium sp.]|jgi:peptidoglycan-associated lipoprotein|nr:peptidoglycan-associated lipoprotein Pal [Endomicrobium sp.]